MNRTPADVEPTFFWHDYETFGKSPRRDRPAQFAGIRTDLELNEVDAPVMLHCQPAPDYLPDPESCLLTGILPQHCLAQGVPEHAFASAIEAQLARPGTIGVGYNSIRFDDEVTRFLFWRNLIEPYAREYKDQCGRWDLLDVLRCCHALRPEGIEWPTHREGPMAGRPSFKLEHLSAANGLSHEAAHDALSDVRATIALARRVRQAQPRLWDFCLKLRKKDAVLQEIGIGRPFLHVSGMYGTERGGIAIVWPLAPHPTNKNELIVWDLSQDPSELFTLDAPTIRQRLYTRADELPEGITRLPLKTIHLNKSPVVIGNLKVLTAERAQHWGIDVERCLAHAEIAARQGASMAGIWPDVYARPVAGASADGAGPAVTDVDEDLYGGFLSNDDRRTLERLRALRPDELADRLADKRPAFQDDRLDELVFRWRARNFPATLSDSEQARWEALRQSRLIEGAGGVQTLEQFFERIDTLGAALADDDERGQDILGALYDYAEQIAP